HDLRGRKILADVDSWNADGAAERRLELALVEHGLELRNLRLRSGGGCLRLVDGNVRADAPLLQFQRPVEPLLVERGLRPRRLEIGALNGVVELHEHVALRHLLIGLEADFLDDARSLDGKVHATGGSHRTNRLDTWRPLDRL